MCYLRKWDKISKVNSEDSAESAFDQAYLSYHCKLAFTHVMVFIAWKCGKHKKFASKVLYAGYEYSLASAEAYLHYVYVCVSALHYLKNCHLLPHFSTSLQYWLLWEKLFCCLRQGKTKLFDNDVSCPLSHVSSSELKKSLQCELKLYSNALDCVTRFWLDNFNILSQYILRYTVENSLTSLITSHFVGWRLALCGLQGSN